MQDDEAYEKFMEYKDRFYDYEDHLKNLKEAKEEIDKELIKNEERKMKKNYILYAILKTIMIVSYTISGTLLIVYSIKMNLDSIIYRIPLFIVGTLAIITGIVTSIRSFLFLSKEI